MIDYQYSRSYGRLYIKSSLMDIRPKVCGGGGGGGGSVTNFRTQGVLTVFFGFFRRDTTTPTLSTGD